MSVVSGTFACKCIPHFARCLFPWMGFQEYTSAVLKPCTGDNVTLQATMDAFGVGVPVYYMLGARRQDPRLCPVMARSHTQRRW